MFTFVTGLNKHKKLGRCKGPQAVTLKDRLSKEEIARIAKQQLDEITVNPRKDTQDLAIDPIKIELPEPSLIVKKRPGRKPKALTENNKIEKADFEVIVNSTEQHKSDYENVLKSSSGRIIKRKNPTIVKQSPISRSTTVNRIAPKSQKFSCDSCGVKFESKNNLDEHLETHFACKKHKCKSCDESFTNLQKLKKHYDANHKKEMNPFKEKRFECDKCGKKYLTAHLLNLHSKSHENLREHKCLIDGCKFETNSPYDLNNHIRRIHNPTRDHECSECNKRFKRRCDMENHKKNVHTIVKTYVKCPICTTIVLEKGLQSHIINRHTEKAEHKPFECKLCGKRERYEKALQRHHEAVHEPKNRGVLYECGHCAQTFNRRRDANLHSFTHYTGTIYECIICGNKYKSRKELTNHEYSHRQIEFACTYPNCTQIFQTQSGRAKHLKKHENELFLVEAPDNYETNVVELVDQHEDEEEIDNVEYLDYEELEEIDAIKVE
jgi:KRAB domain-containing zinc finger protein